MQTDAMTHGLTQLPPDQPAEVDGMTVYLRRLPGGAELGVHLVPVDGDGVVDRSLEAAFQCALEYDGGLALSPDGQMLMLTAWLPGATAWVDAEAALERLLNQADLWHAVQLARAGCEQVQARAAAARLACPPRDEARMRRRVTGMAP